jgi:hypothetical protein
MSSSADISTLYREFTQALTDALAEHAVGPASRGRLARARAAVKKHPIQRAWIFSSSRDRISTVGSIANYRSRGAAVAARASELGGERAPCRYRVLAGCQSPSLTDYFCCPMLLNRAFCSSPSDA